MCDWIGPITTLISALIAAAVAVFGINRAYKYQLDVKMKTRLREIIVDILKIEYDYLTMVDDIKRNVLPTDALTNQKTEDVRDKFWRLIDPISKKINGLRLELEFLAPISFFNVFDELVKRLNECRDEIINLSSSDVGQPHPNLEKAYERALTQYIEFKLSSKKLLRMKKEVNKFELLALAKGKKEVC